MARVMRPWSSRYWIVDDQFRTSCSDRTRWRTPAVFPALLQSHNTLQMNTIIIIIIIIIMRRNLGRFSLATHTRVVPFII